MPRLSCPISFREDNDGLTLEMYERPRNSLVLVIVATLPIQDEVSIEFPGRCLQADCLRSFHDVKPPNHAFSTPNFY